MEMGTTKEFEDIMIDESDPFDIAYTKNAPLEILRRWRVNKNYALILLNMHMC